MPGGKIVSTPETEQFRVARELLLGLVDRAHVLDVDTKCLHWAVGSDLAQKALVTALGKNLEELYRQTGPSE